ncbi:MAG: prolipoprotein diacylglyceryl transferase, partial [Treponema sp.]|nr:prolipoprotein diacylglyceryl transferase [Treponema sp.]
GFIGGLIAMIIWCRAHKRPLWKWIDAMCAAIPLGFTFGRIGNFMNGELYGRITTMPWGMIFPNSEQFSSSLEWVQDIMTKVGMSVSGADPMVYLPRHPSQLYEALFEGLILWVILWNLRKKKPFDGFIASCYTIGYGLFRFVIEYFREPDADLGFRITVDKSRQYALNTSLLNISTGQILCFIMIVGGLILMFVTWRLSKKGKKTKATSS